MQAVAVAARLAAAGWAAATVAAGWAAATVAAGWAAASRRTNRRCGGSPRSAPTHRKPRRRRDRTEWPRRLPPGLGARRRTFQSRRRRRVRRWTRGLRCSFQDSFERLPPLFSGGRSRRWRPAMRSRCSRATGRRSPLPVVAARPAEATAGRRTARTCGGSRGNGTWYCNPPHMIQSPQNRRRCLRRRTCCGRRSGRTRRTCLGNSSPSRFLCRRC